VRHETVWILLWYRVWNQFDMPHNGALSGSPDSGAHGEAFCSPHSCADGKAFCWPYTCSDSGGFVSSVVRPFPNGKPRRELRSVLHRRPVVCCEAVWHLFWNFLRTQFYMSLVGSVPHRSDRLPNCEAFSFADCCAHCSCHAGPVG
jgi:hypothetical protein